jgi:hypothetical protein
MTRGNWCFHALAIFEIGELLNSAGMSDSGGTAVHHPIADIAIEVNNRPEVDRLSPTIIGASALTKSAR